MARRFLDDIRTDMAQALLDIQATIYTNATQDVSGDDVQNAFNILEPLWQDMIDSCIQDEAALGGSASMTFSLGTTWVPINDALAPPVLAYDTVTGGDADFLKVDQVDGSITTSATPGFSYETIGQISIDASNNTVVEAAILQEGVPLQFIGSIIGTGGIRAQSIYLSTYSLNHTANCKYQLGVRVASGTDTVTVTPRQFGVIIVPTNNP